MDPEHMPLFLGSLIGTLAVAMLLFVLINRKMTSRLLRRRTKELLREFRTNLTGLESKLSSAIASREEIALEIDRRVGAHPRPAIAESPTGAAAESWKRFRTEMPKVEDKIKQHGEKEKGLIQDINAVEAEYIKVKELADAIKGSGERAALVEQLDTFHNAVSRALYSSERFVSDCGETLREVVTNVAPLFRLCDCCGASDNSIFVCLNCGVRYCENCKGGQIGHCVKCAPAYKSLHSMEISD